MQKVYLLLRDSRQSGPYSIGELLQQSLRPTDMIWVEGKSTAWAYVSELELFPSTGTVDSAPAQPVRGVDVIEQKAEELRKRALNYVPPRFATDHTEVVKHVPIPENEVPEEEIDFVDHRQEKHSVVNEVLMTMLIIALFAGGLYGGRTLFMSQRESVAATPATTTIVATDQHAAVSQVPPLEAPASTPIVDSVDTSFVEPVQPVQKTAVHRQRADTAGRKPVVTQADLSDIAANAVTEQPPAQTGAASENEKAANNTTTAATDSNTPSKEDEQATADKKKGVGQAIKNLFRKKKKDEDKGTAEMSSDTSSKKQ